MDNQNITPPATPQQPQQPRIEVVETPNHKPVVTYTVLGITVFVFLLQMATLYWLKTDIPVVLGLKVNELIIAGQWWRLFTPMLLHDDQLPLHILSNMYFLAIVGPRLERFTGHRAFLLLYIVAGFAGNVFSFLFSPYAALGASTSLFGLMGAQVIFVLHNRPYLADGGKAALQNALMLIVANIVIGFMLQADNWGHIGGLAGGALFAWFGGPKLDLEEIAFPRFRLIDVRRWREKIFAAALVMLIFGGFAVLKITGIAF
jgi:rhomboid protease GluP